MAENQMAGTTKKPLADARENLTSAATVTVILEVAERRVADVHKGLKPGPAKKLIAGKNEKLTSITNELKNLSVRPPKSNSEISSTLKLPTIKLLLISAQKTLVHKWANKKTERTTDARDALQQ